MKKSLLIFFTVFNSFYGLSYNITGGFIEYECISNNVYVLSLNITEDCGTASITDGPEQIFVSNSCGISFPSTILLPMTSNRVQSTQICDQQLQFSECNGGPLNSSYVHKWSDTITLPGQCDSWVFSYNNC